MHSGRDIEAQIKERAKEVADDEDPFIDFSIGGTWEVDRIEDYGDFEYYAEELFKQGKSESTVSTLHVVKNRLEQFTETPTKVGEEEAVNFKQKLEEDLKPGTVKNYISRLDKMAQFYLSYGYYDGNPFHNITETIDKSQKMSASLQGSDRITVPDSELRAAIRSTHGNVKIIILTLLVKTGIRVSELVNLNWTDVHIDAELADELLPAPRVELDDKPDTLYIDPTVTENKYNTTAKGNKRKVESYIPIDAELKNLLLWYRTVQPRNFSKYDPLLRRNNQSENPGRRFGINTIDAWIKEWGREYGWHERGRDEKENVTPHWFRAKFSTYMVERLRAIDDDGFNENPKEVTKGLRGDVGQDVIEDYIMRYDFYSSYIRPRQFKIGVR